MDDTKTPGGVTGKGFIKGDPRINRKGRPKSFDALRKLAQGISHEVALKGGEPLVIDGHIATVSEMILRQWAQSKDPRLQQAFINYAYGKVPDKLEASGIDGNAIKVEYVNTPYPASDVPPEPGGDTSEPK